MYSTWYEDIHSVNMLATSIPCMMPDTSLLKVSILFIVGTVLISVLSKTLRKKKAAVPDGAKPLPGPRGRSAVLGITASAETHEKQAGHLPETLSIFPSRTHGSNSRIGLLNMDLSIKSALSAQHL